MDSLFKRLTAIGDTLALMKYLQASTIEEAKANTAPNRKTGHLQRSIVRGQVNATSATVKVNVPYAASLEYGARPHRIPKSGNTLLAWPATAAGRKLSGKGTAAAKRGSLGLGGKGGIKLVGVGANSGTYRYAMHVNHPGNKPYPYLIPGAKRAIEKSHEIVVKEWNGAA